MKRFVVMMIFLPCILMACTQKKAKKSTPISYQEPEWGMIDIESISDKDDWFHNKSCHLITYRRYRFPFDRHSREDTAR